MLDEKLMMRTVAQPALGMPAGLAACFFIEGGQAPSFGVYQD